MNEKYAVIVDLFKRGYTSAAVTEIQQLEYAAGMDAERYRWMRDQALYSEFWRAWEKANTTEEMDAAVDKHMQLDREQQEYTARIDAAKRMVNEERASFIRKWAAKP